MGTIVETSYVRIPLIFAAIFYLWRVERNETSDDLNTKNTHPQQDTKKLQATDGDTGRRDRILSKVLEGCNNGVHGGEV